MEKITLTIKDDNKLKFFLELLKQFDFIEIQKSSSKRKKATKHDLFASAGIWKDRNINAQEIREKAWQRAN